MTDKEIKQALECCGDETGLHWCVDCPSYNKENDLCQEELNRDALALINRLQAEIKQAKTEAIKEFAEKLINKLDATHDMVNLNQKIVVTDTINMVKRLEKEMAGGENAASRYD